MRLALMLEGGIMSDIEVIPADWTDEDAVSSLQDWVDYDRDENEAWLVTVTGDTADWQSIFPREEA